MAEILFILTVIFVAYVVYAVVGDQLADMKAITPKADSHTAIAEAAKTAEVKVVENKPAQRTAKKAPEPVAKAPEAEESSASKSGLRDPATGETASIPTNYRFAKRWIKEAMVKEGLLDKVYKNSELDDEANAKIKTALDGLLQMDKYRA